MGERKRGRRLKAMVVIRLMTNAVEAAIQHDDSATEDENHPLSGSAEAW